MGEDQLALRTNDRWLPEEKGPTTNEKGPTTNADFGWVIPVYIFNALSIVHEGHSTFEMMQDPLHQVQGWGEDQAQGLVNIVPSSAFTCLKNSLNLGPTFFSQALYLMESQHNSCCLYSSSASVRPRGHSRYTPESAALNGGR